VTKTDVLRYRARPLVLWLVAASACGTYWMPDRNIRDQVPESAVVGTWRLTEESVQLAIHEGFRRAPEHRYTVTFRADHTCEFASIHTDNLFNYIYEVVPCTWKLKHDTPGLVDGRKANELMLTLNRGGTVFSTGLFFAREGGELILWDYFSDPDLWKFLEYRKYALGPRPTVDALRPTVYG
jgi:hypothetical protein